MHVVSLLLIRIYAALLRIYIAWKKAQTPVTDLDIATRQVADLRGIARKTSTEPEGS